MTPQELQSEITRLQQEIETAALTINSIVDQLKAIAESLELRPCAEKPA